SVPHLRSTPPRCRPRGSVSPRDPAHLPGLAADGARPPLRLHLLDLCSRRRPGLLQLRIPLRRLLRRDPKAPPPLSRLQPRASRGGCPGQERGAGSRSGHVVGSRRPSESGGDGSPPLEPPVGARQGPRRLLRCGRPPRRGRTRIRGGRVRGELPSTTRGVRRCRPPPPGPDRPHGLLGPRPLPTAPARGGRGGVHGAAGVLRYLGRGGHRRRLLPCAAAPALLPEALATRLPRRVPVRARRAGGQAAMGDRASRGGERGRSTARTGDAEVLVGGAGAALSGGAG